MFREGIAESALRALRSIHGCDFSSQFYLAGGTAAAILLGHRLSIDLNYFSSVPFTGAQIAQSLVEAGIEPSQLELSPKTLHCVIEGAKVSFLAYEHPLLVKTALFEQTSIASLLDIGLMKIIAIASRGMKKDFIDLYFILKSISLQTLLDNFSNKYPIDRIDPYHYLRSLTFFDDAENDPMPQMLIDCDWPHVKDCIRLACRGLLLG